MMRKERRMRGQGAPLSFKRGSAGYTLLELLIVLTIIGLILSLVGPRALNYLSDSRAKTAKLQIENLGAALDLFFFDVGRHPTALEGLTALVEQPAGVERWRGPYLRSGNVPLDPWGNPYHYNVPGERSPYVIKSLGADGKEGGDGGSADISSQSP